MAERQLKRKPRAKSMLPAIRELIVQRALEDREKDRGTLADELIPEIKEKFPREIPPVYETLVRKISEARNHAKNPVDEQWHLGMIKKYPFPPEALPYILKVKKLRNFQKLTVRQASWIAYLFYAVGDIKLLSTISWYYSFYETISDIAGTDFDTSKYDLLLVDKSGQKALVDQFQEMQDTVDWTTYKKVHRQLTGIPVADPIHVIAFRGNKAYGIRAREPNYDFGDREKCISELVKDGQITSKEAAELPKVDFDLQLRKVILILKAEEACEEQ